MENQYSLAAHNEALLKDLHLFCAVARKASFIVAATELGISPSHLSKRIATLEAGLGVKLFLRTTRRVTITSDGEAAFLWAQKIIEDVQGMADAFASRTSELRGQLRISTSQRLGRDHIAPILSMLRKRHPHLELWLELLDRRVDLIGENFDIDVRVGDVVEPHLVAQRIIKSARILCAAPEYLERNGEPRTLSDLTRHDCLPFRGRDDRFGMWRLVGPQGEESIKVIGAMASNHTDIVYQWALAGHGIIMVSIWDVADNLKDGSLVRVLPNYLQPADVWAVTATRASTSAKVSSCINFLKEQLNDGPFALNTQGLAGL